MNAGIWGIQYIIKCKPSAHQLDATLVSRLSLSFDSLKSQHRLL